MEWATLSMAAREAFRKGVNDWILASRVQGGVINGPNAELTPGSLGSRVNFEADLRQALIAARAPAPAAAAMARELYGAWTAWSDGFRLSLPGAYPKLAAVPGPRAPRTPAAQPAYPIARGASSGEARLRSATLFVRLRAAMVPYAGRDAAALEPPLRALTDWVEASFTEWKTGARIIGLTGAGPVPTFAPPYVPVGPVVMGDNLASPGHLAAAIAGPRFGRTVP